jgi:hypothetical protein
MSNHKSSVSTTSILPSKDAIDTDTGVFTAPYDGYYEFFFQTISDATDDTQVVLYKNDGTGKSVGWDYYTGYSQGLFITSIIGMDAGDTMRASAGTQLGDDTSPAGFTHFTGKLIKRY